jgi:alpha-L-rhamnosidase
MEWNRFHRIVEFGLSLMVFGGLLSVRAEGNLVVTNLRCEYQTNPRGIDDPRPRLSWVIQVADEGLSTQRGVVQSAYQILVASSPDQLVNDQGDLWDSGKIDSRQSSQIEYSGKLLVSRKACYWKVRMWDGKGNESAWSSPALWTMGLLNPEDWKAHWITAENAACLPLLRTSFRVDQSVRRAELAICGLGSAAR